MTISSKDQRTKRRIQEILKLSGAQDAGQLAEELAITAMAVRQHLYGLAEENLVEFEEVARPKGRPAKLWKLTADANRLFPDAHAELSIGLIDSMKQVFGEEGVAKLIKQRGHEQLASYQEAIDPFESTEDRLAAFTAKRCEEGYMASFEHQEDDGFIFVENHCPICAAASACSNLCAMEFEIIETLFPSHKVTREDHILNGARRCAYKLTSK